MKTGSSIVSRAADADPRWRPARRGWCVTVGCLAVAAFWHVAAAQAPPEGFHARPLPVPASGRAGFTLLPPPETGLHFTNVLSDAKAAENQIRLNGSGVALGDVDGDGWCDIYLCGLENGNALFKNLGNWRFTNITARAGVACEGQYSTGATLVDIDGDGDLDLLVNGIGTGTRLFLNDGRGVFTEVTDSGLNRDLGATTSALADIDGDGDLDLYVANYRTTTIRTTGFAMLNVGGRRMIRPEDRDRLELTPQGRVLEHGEPDFLYRNLGDGRFAPVSWTDGTFLDEDGRPLRRPPFDWSLAAMFRDLNGDGHPDLYVCADFHSTDKIWLNDGRGRFRAAPRLMFRHTSTFSMAVDAADVNRDGWDDIFVADMLGRQHARRLMQLAAMDPHEIRIGVFQDRPQYDHATLQLNRGDGTYVDVVFYAGLETSDWNWSAVFLDVDLDGYEDLLKVCGHQFDTQDLDAEARIQAKGPWPTALIPQKLLMFPRMSQPKLAFRNQGDLTFRECGAAWGFDQSDVSHGLALADLDNDGDLDAVVNNLNGVVGVYRNESAAPRVSVRLRGVAPNTGGVGARIKLLGGPAPEQTQERLAGGRYLSSDEGLRVFAAGSTSAVLRLEVHWRSGRRSVIESLRPNHQYEVFEAAAPLTPVPRPAPPRIEPYFEDVSRRLRHTHTETPFDDFQAQPLLPWRLSQLGPGVAWFDVDGDGAEELFIGGGRGGQLAVYHWDGESQFFKLTGGPVDEPFPVDQSGLAGWIDANGERWLLAGQMEWEGGGDGGVTGFNLLRETRERLIPGWGESVGPLAVGDVDGDGQLEVFVGGRVRAGRYPAACRSKLFRLQDGRLVEDGTQTAALNAAGRVTAALLCDLDGDGLPELVVACEWGPLRVYRNDRGRFRDMTAAWGLDAWSGWWNGVAAGDFDGDGRLDLLATNWGLNTKYRARPAHPRRLYSGDYDRDGTVDLIETYVDPLTGREVPERDLTTFRRAIPMIGARFTTHAAFGAATVRDIFGDWLDKVDVVSVNHLASMVFLNRGNRFEARPLPAEAQFAPAFAAVVADFDGDGHQDVFLSQNFFAYQPQTTRSDAGRGLWLRGDGRGGFTPLSGPESGVLVYGEQRGAAVADYDGDGRADLVVTQNGAATRLFRNVRARPGVRVRLAGPPGNPHGVGAVVRARWGERAGPALPVLAGSGYWSQNSAILLLTGPEPPTAVRIRWPGGRITEAPVPSDAREVVFRWTGGSQVLR